MMLARTRLLTQAEKSWLLLAAGSATAVVEARTDIRSLLPDATERVSAALRSMVCDTDMAWREIDFANHEKLDVIPITAPHYPQRLKQIKDAPPVLFQRGYGKLNPRHCISVVGTRRSTPYGHDAVQRLVAGLAEACPGLMIVSGLAYGIDIQAHRAALEHGLPTVAVLAHGLDRLYPSLHRDTALRMEPDGGLLTEHMSGTAPDRLNFLTRNRIVAAMSDATVVIESAHHGGALATARLARECGRPVAAVPGRMGDEFSVGCNNLIREGKATLINSAADLIASLGWQDAATEASVRRQGVELALFPELNETGRRIVAELRANGDMHVDAIAAALQIPAGRLSAELFTLEMSGVVRPLAGGIYHII